MPRLPTTRHNALFVLVVLGVLAGAPSARAQVEVEASDPGHAPGGASSDIYKAPAVAQRLFADMVCMCGDCKRLTLKACGCPNAVQERAKILALLGGKDLSTRDKEQAAYEAVRDAFIAEYGGQHILTVPIDTGFNRLGWIVPWAVFVLCLGMVFVVGRRWVLRGRQVTAARLAAASAGGGSVPTKSDADEAREDRLDDELRNLD